ncbi:hypothetical protein IWX50DRAFT_659436 [Phyllosticta citricarpa]|uniref:Uncharacterized protein n=1 Tax=Phyllosticta citricarpa TaxID=55181 RepID=A0ABR1LLJ4_9PEZI
MDLNALNHEYHKIMVDPNVTTVRNRDPDAGSPPPAYTPHDQRTPQSISDGTLDDDDDDDDDDEEEDEEDDLYADPALARSRAGSHSRSLSPISTQDDETKDGEKTIHINNKLTVLGSQNIITASPLDGMRWTASILAILNGNRPLPYQEHQNHNQNQNQNYQQRAAAAPAVTEGHTTTAHSIFAPRAAAAPVNILIDCSVHVVGNRNIVGGNPATAAYGALAAAGARNSNSNRDNNAAAAQSQSQTQTQNQAQAQTNNNGIPHATGAAAAAAAPGTAPNSTANRNDDHNNNETAPLTHPSAAALPPPPPSRPTSLAGSSSPPVSSNGGGGGGGSSSSSTTTNHQPPHANGARKRRCAGHGVASTSAAAATVDGAPLVAHSFPSPPHPPASTAYVNINAVAAQLADAGVCAGFERGATSVRKRGREEGDEDDDDDEEEEEEEEDEGKGKGKGTDGDAEG